MDNHMIQNIAKQIIAEAKQSRSHYNATGNYFDKVKANMYTIFECYANGIIDWELSNIKLQSVIKEYVNLYPKENRKAEIKIMREEYKRMKTEYKPALDAYKVVAEQKMTSSLVAKQKLDESTAQHHSNVFYNGRNLTEADLKDISTLKTWKRVMEAYPNLTAKDEDCVRMLTVFENTYNTRDFEFNPRAGHRDQPDHPENRGLTPGQAPTASLRPKLRPKNLAPMSSPRPQARPANLQMRNDINKAVQQAVGEGDSPHKKGTAKYKAHMAAMHAEGYKELPPINRNRYQERDGLEGPFSTLSGKVVYYDPKEGSYYDPDTDMYMSYGEFKALDNDYSNMKDERDKVKENPTTRPNNRPTVPADAEADELLGRIANHQQDVDHFLKVGNDAINHPVAVGLRNRRVKEDEVSEEMNDAEIDAFHTALDNLVHKHLGHSSHEKEMDESTVDEADETKYGIVRYPDTAISYIKNDGNGWEHIFDKSYGFEGPVDKEDFKFGKIIDASKVPSRLREAQSLSDSVIKKALDEMTSSGSFASVATPMGKMKRRQDTIFASKEMNEEHSPSVVKQALAIASKMGGNMTGATAAIEKLSPGLSKHPQVAAVLKRANESQMMSESQFDEAAGEKDACYRKVKSRYKVWPSAYASGALVKCRKVGASNWGNSKK